MMLLTQSSYLTINGLTISSIDDRGVYWVLSDVKGMGAPAGTLTPVQKPRQPGAWVGLSYAKGRSLVLNGAVGAPTQDLAVNALDQLNAAFSLDTSMLTIVQGSDTRWLNVRRDGDVLPVWLSATDFTYSVQLFAPDPRMFGTALSASTFLPASSGGLQWADQWPQKWSAATVSGQIALTNLGNEVGSVIARIDGPSVGPQIGHVGSGAVLVFSSSLVLGVGEWLTVDMDKHTAMANDQSSRSSYITSRGWSGFDPGVNVWSFSATGYDPASKLTVTATPASK